MVSILEILFRFSITRDRRVFAERIGHKVMRTVRIGLAGRNIEPWVTVRGLLAIFMATIGLGLC